MLQQVVKMATVTATYTWIPWTAKSAAMPFISSNAKSRGAAGPGENKVVAELGCAAPNGQNSPYDLEIDSYKYDVKKLDEDGSFNTGVSGCTALRAIKTKIANLLPRIHTALKTFPDFKAQVDAIPVRKDMREKIEAWEFNPDELAEGTLEWLYKVCPLLHAKQSALQATLPSVKPIVDPYTGAQTPMTAEAYYTLYKKLGTPLPVFFLPHQAALEALEVLNHDYIRAPETFKPELTGLTRMFDTLGLVLVDEKEGYCIIKCPTSAIVFKRITQGHPRFKVRSEALPVPVPVPVPPQRSD